MEQRWLAEIGPGWHSLASQAIKELEDLGAKITQVKEKFGGLRIYCYDYGGHSYDKIHEITSKAENKSFSVCEVCGNPGKTVNDNHWMKTRCSKCL